MTENEIRITYEVLFDLIRREKNREELQKLDNTFYEDVLSYIYQKNMILADKLAKNEAKEEIKRLSIQLENINKLLRGLYDRREKKIIVLALNKVRLPQHIVNTSALLPEEKQFFENITKILQHYRGDILDKVLHQQKPSLQLPNFLVQQKDADTVQQIASVVVQQTQQQSLLPDKPAKTVKFLQSVPKFLGEEMELYGPYQTNDIATLPGKIADILIHKGRAEEVKQEVKIIS